MVLQIPCLTTSEYQEQRMLCIEYDHIYPQPMSVVVVVDNFEMCNDIHRFPIEFLLKQIQNEHH